MYFYFPPSRMIIGHSETCKHPLLRDMDTWNNGNRDPRWGVAELQKMSPPTTVGDAADMQLLCYQTRESPSSGKCSIFCYRLTYISKMCSMHHNNLKLSGQVVSNPPEKSHRCEAYVCCCPIFGHR